MGDGSVYAGRKGREAVWSWVDGRQGAYLGLAERARGASGTASRAPC